MNMQTPHSVFSQSSFQLQLSMQYLNTASCITLAEARTTAIVMTATAFRTIAIMTFLPVLVTYLVAKARQIVRRSSVR